MWKPLLAATQRSALPPLSVAVDSTSTTLVWTGLHLNRASLLHQPIPVASANHHCLALFVSRSFLMWRFYKIRQLSIGACSNIFYTFSTLIPVSITHTERYGAPLIIVGRRWGTRHLIPPLLSPSLGANKVTKVILEGKCQFTIEMDAIAFPSLDNLDRVLLSWEKEQMGLCSILWGST